MRFKTRTVSFRKGWLLEVSLITAIVLAFGLPFLLSSGWAHYFYLDISSIGEYLGFYARQMSVGNVVPAWNSVNSQPADFPLQYIMYSIIYSLGGSVELVIKVLDVFFVWIAATSAYLLIKWYTGKGVAGIVGGLLFGFSPFIMASIAFNPFMLGWVLLPLGCLAIELSFYKTNVVSVILAGMVLAFSMQTFAENGALLGLVYLILAVCRIAFPIKPSSRTRRMFVAFGVLSVTVLLFIGFSPFTYLSRTGYPSPYESPFSAYQAQNVMAFSNTLIQAFSTLHTEAYSWLASYNGFQLSLGYNLASLLPSIIFGVALLFALKPQFRKMFPFALVALVSIVIGTGTRILPVWSWLKAVVPYFGYINEPVRFLIGTTFAFSIVIGLGVGHLLNSMGRQAKFNMMGKGKMLRNKIVVGVLLFSVLTVAIFPAVQTWSVFETIPAPGNISTSQLVSSSSDLNYRTLDTASSFGQADYYTYGSENYWNYYDTAMRYGNRPYYADLLGQLGYKNILYSPSTMFRPYDQPTLFASTISQESKTSSELIYPTDDNSTFHLNPLDIILNQTIDLKDSAWCQANMSDIQHFEDTYYKIGYGSVIDFTTVSNLTIYQNQFVHGADEDQSGLFFYSSNENCSVKVSFFGSGTVAINYGPGYSQWQTGWGTPYYDKVTSEKTYEFELAPGFRFEPIILKNQNITQMVIERMNSPTQINSLVDPQASKSQNILSIRGEAAEAWTKAFFVNAQSGPLTGEFILLTYRTVGYASRLSLYVESNSTWTLIDTPLDYPWGGPVGSSSITQESSSSYVSYLLPLSKIRGITLNVQEVTISSIILKLSTPLEGYAGPLQVDIKDLELVTLNQIETENGKPVLQFLGGRGIGTSVQIGGSFTQPTGFVKFIATPTIPVGCRCLAFRGGPTLPNATLTVEVEFSDGTKTDLDVKQINVPQYLEQRITLPTTKTVSGVSVIVRAGGSGYSFVNVIDSELYLYEIYNAKPTVWAASGLYVLGGPDAYAYLDLPMYNASTTVPIFSGLNPLDGSDLEKYSGFLFYDTNTLDVLEMLASNHSMAQLWQYADGNNWTVDKTFMARQFASQVQNNAEGQFVFSKYAAETGANSSMTLNFELKQSGTYHILVRVMGSDVSPQPFKFCVKVNGEVRTVEISQNKFVTVDLGAWNLSEGLQFIEIWKNSPGSMLGDFIDFVPEGEWQNVQQASQQMMSSFGGSILLLSSATSFYSETQVSQNPNLPFQLTQNSLKIPPGASATYQVTVPQSGEYTPFIHSIVANTTLEATITGANSESISQNISKTEHTDNWNVWEYKVGHPFSLANGTVAVTLTNFGPSFAVVDLWGLIKIVASPNLNDQVSASTINSENVLVNGSGANFFLVYQEVNNDGWLANQAGTSLEHLSGFFFLNVFYVNEISAQTSVHLTYSNDFVGGLRIISFITFVSVMAVLAVFAAKKVIRFRRSGTFKN
jgi:hypothetical protein